MSIIAMFPHGRLETYDDNELKHASSIGDPGKYRFSVPEALVESNLGATTFNTERTDGRLDERASVGARLLADGSAAVFIAVAEARGQPIREILLVSRNGMAGPAAPQGGGSPPNELVSPGGTYRLSLQDDKGFVLYFMHADGSGTPVGRVEIKPL